MKRGFNLIALLKSTISLSFEPSYKLKAKFHILDAVDSTNNYAMARVNDGLAQHGEAWFTHEQTIGRGQPGKSWISEKGKNVLLSIILRPDGTKFDNIFHFNAFISLIVREFIQKRISLPVYLKWPNDFYISDRKAGGMLIENKFQGKEWKWSIIGIGINVNQKNFESGVKATSIASHTELELHPETLAQELHMALLEALEIKAIPNMKEVLTSYNQNLYKKHEFVSLFLDDSNHECQILGVDEEGVLWVDFYGKTRKISHGEARWNIYN